MQLRSLGHHALVPLRVPDQLDVGFVHFLDHQQFVGNILLQHGAFTAQSTHNVSIIWIGYTIGLVPVSVGMLGSRLINALQAHSVLFKFYHLTGGDTGMRVPRMHILGFEFAAYNKLELLAAFPLNQIVCVSG